MYKLDLTLNNPQELMCQPIKQENKYCAFKESDIFGSVSFLLWALSSLTFFFF